MLYGVHNLYRPALVLPEELLVAISVPCPDKFTVPQHAYRHVHAHPEASHALTRPAHSARPASLDRPLSLALAVKHVIVHAHLQAARTTGERAI